MYVPLANVTELSAVGAINSTDAFGQALNAPGKAYLIGIAIGRGWHHVYHMDSFGFEVSSLNKYPVLFMRGRFINFSLYCHYCCGG
jgi:hypothetical protein